MSLYFDQIKPGAPICDRLALLSKQIYFRYIKVKSEIRGGRKAKVFGGTYFFQIKNQTFKTWKWRVKEGDLLF